MQIPVQNDSLIRLTLADAASLVELGRDTFRDAYHGLMKEEDLDSYIGESFTLSLFQDYLRSDQIYAFGAKIEGEWVGYSMMRAPVAPPATLTESTTGEIGRLYLKRSVQGKGLGLVFMRKQFEIAQALSLKGLWLSVWEKNTQAVRFYQKSGFIKAAEQSFQVGGDLQNDFILWKAL